MIVWQGWGVLVVVIGFGALLGSQVLVNMLVGPGTYEANSNLWGGLALIIGGGRNNGPGHAVEPTAKGHAHPGLE